MGRGSGVRSAFVWKVRKTRGVKDCRQADIVNEHAAFGAKKDKKTL